MSNSTPARVDGPEDLPANCLIAEVAQFFRQSDETIRDWVKKGKLPNAYKPGKFILIPKQDVINLAHEMYGQR